MLVYHGSIEVVDEPISDYSERDDLDFGQGFYVTPTEEEACVWANIKAAEYNSSPIVNVYELDDSYDEDDGFLFFEDTDDTWFNFLDHCRSGNVTYLQERYPIVEGEVADDNGYEIFESYHNGNIDKGFAIEQLSDLDLGHQICFITDEVIHRYLTSIRSYRI